MQCTLFYENRLYITWEKCNFLTLNRAILTLKKCVPFQKTTWQSHLVPDNMLRRYRLSDKKCRTRSDTAERDIWSGSGLFVPTYMSKYLRPIQYMPCLQLMWFSYDLLVLIKDGDCTALECLICLEGRPTDWVINSLQRPIWVCFFSYSCLSRR